MGTPESRFNQMQGEVTWQSPSNIALIKYWGKHGNQLPNNPSVSFTLSQSFTETQILFSPRSNFDREVSLLLTFAGQVNPTFSLRMEQYLTSLKVFLPFINQLHFSIKSSNSFPHSAGIASSASAFSALSMALCDIESIINGSEEGLIDRRKASEIARLGSGSACRSIYPKLAMWGKVNSIADSTDDAAIPMETELHDVFKTYQDAILIVSQKEKEVSSSAGHNLMKNHPFATVRYEEAKKHLHQLLAALKSGDVERVGFICEMEAMQLHALMLCSNPNFILLQPNTLSVISAIKNYRQETKIPIYFTLDAGPNVHLLYPEAYRSEVFHLIEDQLLQYCPERRWINDFVGDGPLKLR